METGSHWTDSTCTKSRLQASFGRLGWQRAYKATGNLRAIQILLGHTKIENTVRNLGADIEDGLIRAKRTEI